MLLSTPNLKPQRCRCIPDQSESRPSTPLETVTKTLLTSGENSARSYGLFLCQAAIRITSLKHRGQLCSLIGLLALWFNQDFSVPAHVCSWSLHGAIHRQHPTQVFTPLHISGIFFSLREVRLALLAQWAVQLIITIKSECQVTWSGCRAGLCISRRWCQ